MSLPRLTHLQFLVISELLVSPIRGRDLRSRLREAGVRQSGPAFYQRMASLEDSGFISGWYEQEIVSAQIIRQRHYKLMASGRKAWEESRDFYARAIARHSPVLAYEI
jgi:DNA-binding PadR family transcriptional regulator